MELSQEDKKILKAFSMYIQSYGSKVARTSTEVGTDGDVYWEFYGWHGDGTRMTIEGYDSIDDLVHKMITHYEIPEKYFDYEDRGNIETIVNTNESTVTFSVTRYVMSTDNYGGTIESQDIPENVLKWIREMRETESYEYGTIRYQGGGDDGYIEGDIEVNGKSGYTYPKDEFEDFFLREIGNFGDWYNNEGGQGDIHINFKDETIEIQAGINFEDEQLEKVPVEIKF
jgi:hypothetical protein